MVTRADERRFFSIAIRAVFLAAGVATVLSWFGQQYWFAELFSHFKLYYLLIQAVLVLIFLQTGRRILLTLTLLLALPNAWTVGPYLAPVLTGSSATAAGPGLDVVALNLHYRNDRHGPVLDYLTSRDPDLVALTEFTPDWQRRLADLHERYPHRIESPRADPWGVAVYSRIPFSAASIVDLGVGDAQHARIVLDVDGGTLELYAVHLYPPIDAQQAADRNRQLDALARMIGGSEGRVLVVGDLNLTPFSPYFGSFLRAAGLRDARRDWGIQVTWPTFALPVWIPIDHALASPSLDFRHVGTGPDVGSDHFPLEVRLAAADAAGARY